LLPVLESFYAPGVPDGEKIVELPIRIRHGISAKKVLQGRMHMVFELVESGQTRQVMRMS
jgi:hypothetical protein